MKKIIILLILPLCLTAQNRPKLVVGIVIDQMKMEYLYRFSDDFGNHGFKRLMNEGYTYHNMHYNYMPTYTAPGHASIYTGTTPAIHGIVGNNWFNKAIGKEMYCTDDENVITLGNGTEAEGKMSPKNLQSSTITDELKLATNLKGKVIGMSIKDRGAILPAGHFADWAFWYSKTGSFISSTFYGENLPDWTIQFNNEKHYEKYAHQNWKLFRPKETYNESLTDNNPYESKIFKKQPFFPYNLQEAYDKKDASILKVTPFGNSLLADFAKEAIAKESLGKDTITDFLTISFSSTDYIGHALGPRAIELQDTYLRLDETLADFLNYLDKQVGKNNYLVFVTADHAGAENVTYLKDHKYDVDNIVGKNFDNSLRTFSEEKFGVDLVLKNSNFNLFLDKIAIIENNLDYNNVIQQFTHFLYSQKFIKRVYNENEILSNSGFDYYLNYIAKGYDPVQNGELVYTFKPGYIEYSITGTSHGSPYTYDTHVPGIFYGWHIPKGKNHTKKYITQIAPTLAQKLQITFPNSTKAEVLEDILE